MFKRLQKLTQTCLFLLCLITIMSFLGKYWWVFDLLAHFRMQYILCALSGLIALAIINLITGQINKKYIGIAILLSLINIYPVMGFYFQKGAIGQDVQPNNIIKVMSLNLYDQNNDYANTLIEIEHQDPDLLFLIEFTHKWARNLSKIDTRYPYKIALPRKDSFGIALYSKTPFHKKNIKYWGDYRLPYVEATLKTKPRDRLHILGFHTNVPLRKMKNKDNHNQLAFMLEQATKFKQPTIILGDFNNTPWSYSYQASIRGKNLYNASRRSLLYATWMKHLLGGLFIDHIIVTNDIYVQNWSIGNDIGSDHRAIIADIAILSCQMDNLYAIC